MKRVIGVLLFILSLYLGYSGVTKFSKSSKSVDIVGIEISAEDNQKKTTSYIYMGFALVSFIGGMVLVQTKKT